MYSPAARARLRTKLSPAQARKFAGQKPISMGNKFEAILWRHRAGMMLRTQMLREEIDAAKGL